MVTDETIHIAKNPKVVFQNGEAIQASGVTFPWSQF